MTDWDCSAYGPEARDIGALCFFAERNERTCSSSEACHANMAAERRRVFQRINELAAAGDTAGAYLAGKFTHPDQMLNSDQDPDASGDA